VKRDFKRLSSQQFDLAVIGGGINGAAVAHLAALNGLKVALVEKNDFASGTSSKSSKLMHGGIRYLENMEFSLVREALKERTFHLQTLPHLVKPMPFIIPVYKEDARPLWMMKVGTLLYDIVAGKAKIEKHQSLSAEKVIAMEPRLRREGLKGGVLYYDAQMDDARVCLENILSAADLGAEAVNYARVTGFVRKGRRVTGLKVENTLAREENIEIKAKKIVCATGPWTDEILSLDADGAAPRLRPTKGVHFVTSKRLSTNALLIPSKRDRRIFFVLPWKNGSMIGTTDTDYSGRPDDVVVQEDDIQYLLEETSRVFPSAHLTKKDVKVSFAGLRPLMRNEGHASKVSREHDIFETDSGIHVIAGGKYTTYRVIAEECMRKVFPTKKLDRIEKFYGTGEPPADFKKESASYGIEASTLECLWNLYGTRYRDVLAVADNQEVLRQKICPGLPYIKAQLEYSKDVEMALTAEDILYRRLSLGYSPVELKKGGPELKKQIRSFASSLH